MPHCISKVERKRLMIIMRDLAHEARINEYVAQHMVKANPKIWIQKARQHVALQNARRKEIQNWVPNSRLSRGMRRADFYGYGPRNF